MERLNIVGETMGLVLHLDYYNFSIVIQILSGLIGTKGRTSSKISVRI